MCVDPGTLDRLNIWEAIKKLCDFIEPTGLVALQESRILLATTSYIEAMLSENTPLGVILASTTHTIDTIETSLNTLMAQGHDGSIFINPTPASTSMANADCLELLEKVTQLEKQLARRQTVGSDMNVHFRGHIFNSQHDVNNFMKSCIGSSSVPAVSLINDAYTLLNAVAKGMPGQVMDMKDIYSVSRMGDITEADLQNAIAGNQIGVPPFFHGRAAGTPVYTGTAGTGQNNRLKGVLDYAAWGNPSPNVLLIVSQSN